MKVLVAAASRQGATTEIAHRIAEVLADSGFDTTIAPPEDVRSLVEYDAVILGSAVRIGHWLQSARHFAQDHAADLATRPVWLFSSGPIGDPPMPEGDPLDVVDVRAQIGARGHRVFAGKLDRTYLGLAERAITAAVHSPEGDFRPWAEIDAWAGDIAEDLIAEGAVPV